MRTQRGRGTRSYGARRPQNVQWADVSGQFALSAVVATTAVVLIQLQAPASLAALTSDPPEDLTILRMRGAYFTSIGSGSAYNWTLALLVQDTTWTPGATFNVDADKRILWSRTYQGNASTAALNYSPPGLVYETGGAQFPAHPAILTVDIAPKVKIQSGQALHLVAYENGASPSLTIISSEMRVLYKRSGRR